MSLVEPALDYLVRSFHPGYLDSPEPDTVPKGGSPDAKNCLFGSLQLNPPRATLEKRGGSVLLTPSGVVGAYSYDGLYEFRKVGTVLSILVGVVNGKVYYWDNVSAFVQIGVTAPFTTDLPVQFSTIRNLLFLTDGLTTRCWDGVVGTDLFVPGQVAPTAAGALTDGGAVGSGIAGGTFEGFQVWYDSTHDHETSPGPLTAPVVITAAHQRTWAKPGGGPAANYDKWRVYCRRSDTNETYYWKVAETAIANASVSESLSDAVRRLQTLGPLPLTNDPPPLNFAFQTDFQGYRLGVLSNDDQVYASKLGDPQGQHPSDIIGVGRGTGGELRSLTKFGTQCVAQKATRSYRLDGDRMPYQPKQVHGSFGNVGPKSATEIKGRFFAWDLNQGPYWTDLAGRWVPIGTSVIHKTIAAVPKPFASLIECVAFPPLNLVIWAIPTGSSARRRILLAYHTEFETFLPPITGLEFASVTPFTDLSGAINLYVGDHWGRLYQFFVGNVEGVPSGSLIARVSASGAATVTCDFEQTVNANGTFTTGAVPCAFYTTGDGLMGLPVLHLDAAGNAQWRRIQSNTGTQITLDTTYDAPWAPQPQVGDQIVVGGINWYWRSPVIDFGAPFRKKKGGYFAVQVRPGSSVFPLRFVGFKNGLNTRLFTRGFAFLNSQTWGSGTWGALIWGGGDAGSVKTRIGRTFFGFACELSNPYPNQPVGVLSLGVSADPQRGKWVDSGGS